MTTEPRRLDLSPYLRRQPVILALLTVLMVVFFLAVSALTRLHDSQRISLAERWAGRGVTAIKSGNYQFAVDAFRTALLYSRDNAAYQLSLAEALMDLNRGDEARAYLINLWEREPDNGVVNLQLARIAVNRGETQQALRYYHNAIYGTWGDNPDPLRRKTRLELINYLLRINARPEAEAELIDLQAASLLDNAAQQEQLGQMFAQVGDDRRALDAFRASLRVQHHNAAALAGAGEAAYKLGQYADANRFLQEAVAANPNNAEAKDRLKMTEYVLRWDPFRRELSQAQQNRMTLAAFAAVGTRLKSCNPPNAAEQTAQQQWNQLRPQMTARGLEDNPDLVGTAMNLVFTIEKETASTCGTQSETDQALLLVASLHEEN